MWAFGVESVHQAIEVAATLIIPFVQVAPEEADTREFRATRMSTQWLSRRRVETCSDLLKEPFEEWAELSICAGPISPRVRVECLRKLTFWYVEPVLLE